MNLWNTCKRFYLPLILFPWLLSCTGAISNQAVLVANHGKFPVLVNDAQQKEHQSGSMVEIAGMQVAIPSQKEASQYLGDDYHSVMGPNSRLKLLADIFNTGDGVASIGDFLIWAGVWLWKYTPLIWITLIMRKLWDLTEAP